MQCIPTVATSRAWLRSASVSITGIPSITAATPGLEL